MPTLTRVYMTLLLFAGASLAIARLDDLVERDTSDGLLGNYLIAGCTTDRIATLTSIFTAQRQALSKASTDLGNQPGKSRHGFSLFFNTKGNVPKVKRVVDEMLALKKKRFPQNGMGGAKLSPPTFFCLSPDSSHPVSVMMSDYCVPGNLAFYKTKGPNIFICPEFWGRTRSIPTLADCPKPTSIKDWFSGDPQVFLGSQFSALLHELIHFYRSPASNILPEVYDINACIVLPGRESALNAQNYAFYIMGFAAGCTYPLRKTDLSSGRELLWSGIDIETDTIGNIIFNLTASGPPPPGQSGVGIPAPAHNYTNSMLSVPPPANAVINETYASAYMNSVSVTLTDVGGKPGNESCFNQLLHGDYVDDLDDFIGFVLNPIHGGNWTAAGVVKNATDTSIAPVPCMQIMAEVYTGSHP